MCLQVNHGIQLEIDLTTSSSCLRNMNSLKLYISGTGPWNGTICLQVYPVLVRNMIHPCASKVNFHRP